MKALIWGETRERVWATVNSIRDVCGDIEIIIGTGDPYQQEGRTLEAFAAFSKIKFENGYRGKLDFIKAHHEDKFIFAIEGMLINESIREHLDQDVGEIAFANIKIDDGRYLAKCNDVVGGFLEPNRGPIVCDKEGQTLMFFISGGGLKYPKFFTGSFGEGVTLSCVNPSKITDAYVRYIGNLDVQITQSGLYVLAMGLTSTGKFLDNKKELEGFVEPRVSERVFTKVEFDFNRLS